MTPEVFYDAAFVTVGGVNGDELVFTYAGVERRVRTFPQGSAPSHPAGTRGVVVRVRGARGRTDDQPTPLYRFDRYFDQSLVRAPELDSAARFDRIHPFPAELGWRNDTLPEGFHAPVGIIPGKNGEFVHEATTLTEIAIPSEFWDLCLRLNQTPERVLRAFIADAAELMNFVACPRADGYSSNGSDERRLASEYIERTFGVPVNDIDDGTSDEE